MDPTAPFDANMKLLSKVLDLRAKNQQVIASNIANAETPGYSPARLEFEEALRQAVGDNESLKLATSEQGHIPLGPEALEEIQGSLVISHDTTKLGDENNVSVDQEMLALSENEILYEAAAQLLKKKMGMLKYVISGGQ